MNRFAIRHKSAGSGCYALNENDLVINILTGKEVTSVILIHEDPFSAGTMPEDPWSTVETPMSKSRELELEMIWSVTLTPKFKREQYYFEISDGEETLCLFEDGLYEKEKVERKGRMKQYFKFPWLNPSDVISPPSWAGDTVWYQIMPDSFCRGIHTEKSRLFHDWDNCDDACWRDAFGGDIPGIISRLDYIKNLGISGIYLTPLFLSPSAHKYNTSDYTKIDADFGTEEDMVRLVNEAHSRGIRIMVDAVFNHSGTDFFAWQDVLEKGADSHYLDWFFVNSLPVQQGRNTRDGRYFTFAFIENMPKLNTNNPAVMEYFAKICTHWVKDWNIDGIRFDVGNEVSHGFLRHLRSVLKPLKKDLYLLGEIWHDSSQWLEGTEYDSVMNYPFVNSIQNFWVDEEKKSSDLLFALNRVYSLYAEQTNSVLFNFIDSHDISRARVRCGNDDIFFMQLTLLLTMQGSPCIYYGTEIGMGRREGEYNRLPMPWKKIDAGECDEILSQTRALISIRNGCSAARNGRLEWDRVLDESRVVHYRRVSKDGHFVEVWLNSCKEDFSVSTSGRPVFARKYNGEILSPGGIAVFMDK
jgi:glycosidase